ncbi:DeoR/GlpR family DNA-binding transcription regulator [Sediminispirochaeta bajacaliforniensis]|uniref:DeoR/GlpR family DNA-binding transcription regulator n=1 Tax=Sediminispirochaeta bajacaliforniensis TaxID=148 RepID=UPI000378DC0A|nr:DeoR/GlpR family DNA-binding transcription regulator [Sediminispirochaeta bajacaliforniensis]
MNSSLRRGHLIDYLKNSRSATIQELAEHFEVSHMTIRRDLEKLIENQPIKIIHGGVIYQESEQGDHYSIIKARTHMLEAKKKIAKKAASLVEADDIIIIDAGSTGELIAEFLPKDKPITIICYALNIATVVSKRANCTLILTGGCYHGSSMVFESEEGLSLIKRNRAKKAFVTASGISAKLGITCSNFFESTTKRIALKSSLTTILVADSSKFGEIQNGYFSDLSDFDIIITDEGLPPEFRKEIARLEKTLYIE